MRPLALQLLVEGALLLQVVALGAERAHPGLPVDLHAHGPALRAHRLHGERAVDPRRAHLHRPHGVGDAAPPLDLGRRVGRAPEAHLAQDVVLLLRPPAHGIHLPPRLKPRRAPRLAPA